MLIVALTGGIASGKSVVAEVFRSQGCYVESADAAAQALMRPGGPTYDPIVAAFGRGILRSDGTIDRRALADLIFRDPDKRRVLNALTHPAVLTERKRTIARLEADGRTRIYVSEAALTFEAGFEKYFDKIVVTYCSEDIQVGRLMVRDGIDRDEALRKARAQMPAEEKKERADYVVDTSGALEETIAQAQRVYARLAEESEVKRLRRG